MYQTKKEWIKAESYLHPKDGERFFLRLFGDDTIYEGVYLGNNDVEIEGELISYNLVESYKQN